MSAFTTYERSDEQADVVVRYFHDRPDATFRAMTAEELQRWEGRRVLTFSTGYACEGVFIEPRADVGATVSLDERVTPTDDTLREVTLAALFVEVDADTYELVDQPRLTEDELLARVASA